MFSDITSSEVRSALQALSGLDLTKQAVRKACPLPDALRACLRLAAAGEAVVKRLKKLKKAAQLRRELLTVGTSSVNSSVV